MKLKLLTLIPAIELVSAMPLTINTANVASLNANESVGLEFENRLTELKSINKSAVGFVDYKQEIEYDGPSSTYCCLNTMISVETYNKYDDIRKGDIARDDLFKFSSKKTKYQTYCRYEPNNIKKENDIAYGNAKKYQLNVTVPANVAEYKVQIVADCKLKNSINRFQNNRWTSEGVFEWWLKQRTFMQANLSKLSTDPNEILMPAMGIRTGEYPKYYFKDDNTIRGKDSIFLDYYTDSNNYFEKKPHIEAKLTNEITLSNETSEDKEIPVYFWFGFFGGGYTGVGAASHINCYEVWFSANHFA